VWRDAALVASKDLLVEARSKVALNQVVPFALLVALLFGLALGPDPRVLAPAASGLFWVAVLLASVLATQRSFAIEAADGARDGLRLSGLDPAGIFFGKAAAVGLELLGLEGLLALVVGLLYDARLSGGLVLAGSCVLATVGLACVGTIYGVVATGVRVRETLLPLLFLPVVAPVLIAATKAWEAALSGTPSGSVPWLEVLGAFAAIYAAVGAVAFGALLEEG
jgi:heme exporter protein B